MKLFELAIYAVSFALMFNGFDHPPLSEYLSIAGSLLILLGLYVSDYLHGQTIRPLFCVSYKKYNTHPLSLIGLVISLSWAGAAIYQNSQIIALLATLSLTASIAGSVTISRLCYALGYTERTVAPRIILTTLLLLFISLLLTAQLSLLFIIGLKFVILPAFFTALLIATSSYYSSGFNRIFWLGQFIALLASACAFYYGAVYNSNLITNFVGAFLVLYFLAKLIDISWIFFSQTD